MEPVFLWRLGFLDPPAFEEGILEHYPFFLDIVLNHISGDSVEFSHAVTCLRLLFEMLGMYCLFDSLFFVKFFYHILC